MKQKDKSKKNGLGQRSTDPIDGLSVVKTFLSLQVIHGLNLWHIDQSTTRRWGFTKSKSDSDQT